MDKDEASNNGDKCKKKKTLESNDLGNLRRRLIGMKALRSILGWRTTTWRRTWSAWEMKDDPSNLSRWKHKLRFHNRGSMCDTHMTRWTYEGHHWIQKDGTAHASKRMMWLPLSWKCWGSWQHSWRRKKCSGPMELEPRWYPMTLSWQSEVTARQRQIGSVDVQRKKKRQLMMSDPQKKHLRDWWSRGVDLQRRFEGWAPRNFLETHHSGIGPVAKTCAVQVCWLRFSHRPWRGTQFTTKCGPVLGKNSHVAEIAGCSNWSKVRTLGEQMCKC